MKELQKNGFRSVLMHFRGCSGRDNLLPRSYHSGETQDALSYIKHLKKMYPNSKLYALGYSLGANMLLKLLGELQKNSLIDKAIAVSPPMQLDVCSNQMNKGFSRYYQHRLLQDLNAALEKKYRRHDMQVLLNFPLHNVKKIKTFWQFDDTYTAPIHGFNSAQDYYTQCSSKQYLKYIQTPTLIIHSQDDPFMTPEVIPKQEELSPFITLELSKKGGHVGFIAGSPFKPIFWLEKRIVTFFQNKTSFI